MDTLTIFGCTVLWLVGVCLTLTWVLKIWPMEEDPIETIGPATFLCLFLWPVVLAGLAALTLSGQRLERKPEVRLCGCKSGEEMFEEWTDPTGLKHKVRRKCCYEVTKERLKHREETRRGRML